MLNGPTVVGSVRLGLRFNNYGIETVTRRAGTRRKIPADAASARISPRDATAEALSGRQGAAFGGPRIYHLHPRLAGPIGGWPSHFDRIAGMGFNVVHAGSFFAPGGSGSLDAIRDPRELDPMVRGADIASADSLIGRAAEAAASRGLRLLTELVIPHTGRGSQLSEQHPDWLRRDVAGHPISPALPGEVDGRRARLFADLVELDLSDERLRPQQLDHFEALARHLLDLGLSGFRVAAAHRVPVLFARALFERARRHHPNVLFVGAALGCPFEQVVGLAGAGYDFLLDSSRWWDFRSPWLLDQLSRLRWVAPTIAFPEDPDTPRLAAEHGVDAPEAIERLYRRRYLLAATVGGGVLMPMGFEYGCRRPLDPVQTRSDDWETETALPTVDLTGFIAEVNRIKAALPPLSGSGTLRRVTAPDARLVGLARFDAGTDAIADQAAILVINSDLDRADGIDGGPLVAAAGGRIDVFEDLTPGTSPLALAPGSTLTLDPGEARLFHGRASVRRPMPARARAAERRLEALAASRVAIERVAPELDGGRFPIKRVVGDLLEVSADIFCDGHDKIAACIRYRARDETDWREVPMTPSVNDRWSGRMPLTRNIRYVYTVEAWRDLFASWCAEIAKKHEAGQSLSLELAEGRQLVEQAAEAADGAYAEGFRAVLADVDRHEGDTGALIALYFGDTLTELMRQAGLRINHTRYDRELEVVVDRRGAAFAAWFEVFPRSMSDDPERHGTFDDVIAKLPYVRDMGFDVLYFPPIHPIGRTNRKGRNNSLVARPGDPGSPYAIGAEEGGHDALHPELGSFDDFSRLITAARDNGLEIALDFAIQCSPDHPWIREHPEWFDWRPDGTIRFAENPPKKYEDIVNVHFYRHAIPAIWKALRDVVLFWLGHGVKIFRVDNPHTKPYPFWEWMIREVQDRDPEVVFLAEAFTRPKVMKRLAKLGFTQSYSYFTWRETKADFVEYLTELTQGDAREHMRPNFFVNTPDINPVHLQTGGRPAFRVRAVLAATLSPLWGVYNGFELCEGTPVPGKEEYLDSEKYEIRAWDRDRPGHIREDITRLNHLRRDNPALWGFSNLAFHTAWNDEVLVYSKMTAARDNIVIVAVNLDPHGARSASFEAPLWEIGLPDDASVAVEDLMTGHRFTWHGKVQHIWLDPHHNPYAIWRLIPPGT